MILFRFAYGIHLRYRFNFIEPCQSMEEVAAIYPTLFHRLSISPVICYIFITGGFQTPVKIHQSVNIQQ